MLTKFPVQCVLARQPERLISDWASAFVLVKCLEDSSRCYHSILRCAECGQLHFHDFEDGWDGNGDYMYSSLVPVHGDDEIKAIRAAPGRGLTNWEPRLCVDSGPKRAIWVGTWERAPPNAGA